MAAALQSRRPRRARRARVERTTVDNEIDKRAERYGGAALLAAERERDETRRATMREFRARFVDGPVLLLPLRKMQFEIDPNEAVPFEAYGTVYPKITLRDEWGSIEVQRGGALIASDWTHLTVSAAPEGHQLTLNAGWTVVPGARRGDTTVDKR